MLYKMILTFETVNESEQFKRKLFSNFFLGAVRFFCFDKFGIFLISILGL